MQPRHPLIFVTTLSLTLVAVSCATTHDAPAQSTRNDTPLSSVTNQVPGSIYDADIYIIEKGDTLFLISKKVQVPIKDLKALNPGLDPTKLRIGQEIRFRETPAH